MLAAALPELYGTGLSGLLCEPGWGLWVCVQVEVLWTSVFCWMVPDRGVTTVAIIHFITLLCFSRAFRVSALAMVHIIQIMIDHVLSRSLFLFPLLGGGVSGGGGLFFSILCSWP